MNLHLFKFFRSQPSGFVDDVLGHGQLTDVMQQCGGAQRFDFICRKANFFGDFYGVGSHALQVRVRGVVFGFDGQSQRLDGAHVQRSNLLHVPLFNLDALFFGLQSAEIQSIGAVHPINQRQNEQRSLPTGALIDDAHQAHRGCANQVVGKRPEVAFLPNFAPDLPSVSAMTTEIGSVLARKKTNAAINNRIGLLHVPSSAPASDS